VLGDPAEFELAWAKANPVRRKQASTPLPAPSKCNVLPSYTSHTQAPGTAVASAAARTAATLPTTAHTLSSAADAVPKVMLKLVHFIP
jgi:hypothetical protein